MRRMGWDTRKPGNVSRRVGLWRGIDTYVNKHDDDGIHHDDPSGAPKEHSVLHGDVSYLSDAEKCLSFQFLSQPLTMVGGGNTR